MSRPVIHEKRWHGMIPQTLTVCGLWLSTACGGDTAVPETPAGMNAQAQAVEGDSCDPDTIPPVLTCDAEAIEECGGYLTEPANLEFSDNCGLQYVDYTYPTYKMPGDISISAFAKDFGNNSSSCTTVFHVLDTLPPDVDLFGPSEITLSVGSEYVEYGAGVYDLCMHGSYGGWSLSRPTTGTVNTQVPGTYVLTYSLTDHSGNTGTATRTVKVVASTPTSTQTASTTQSRLRHTATLLGNGRVLVVGGYSRTAEEYHPSARTWAAVGAPSPRTAGTRPPSWPTARCSSREAPRSAPPASRNSTIPPRANGRAPAA